MPFDYVAGAIFTTQEVILIYSLLFVGASAIVFLLIFGGRLLFNKIIGRKAALNRTFLSSVRVGFAVIALAALLVLIIPTMVRDYRWQHKQQRCAEQVGYDSPADNESLDTSTAYSQMAYHQCLYPNGF